MKKLESSKDFEIEVGQVWKDKHGYEVTIIFTKPKWVCVECKDSILYAWSDIVLRKSHQLIRLSNGADIDTDKYDYAIGDNNAPEFYYAGAWRPRGRNPHHRSLTRTPKQSDPRVVEFLGDELPYVDCEVYEDDDDLCYVDLDNMERTLEEALSDKRLIGFIYDSTTQPSLQPRKPTGKDTPAEIPAYVRFVK